MAIDTRNKRSSAIQPMMPWRGMLPTPDGAVSQADRQHAAYTYAGILAAAPIAAVFVNAGITIYAALMNRTIEIPLLNRTVYSPPQKRTIYAEDVNRQVE